MQAGVYHIAARVSCRKENCGQQIELLSEGADSPHQVECPTHGKLALFRNFADYAEALKTVINESSAAMGLPTIDADAQAIFERDN